MPVEVTVNAYRTSKDVAGRDVIEYSVSASNDPLPEPCLSWHRYTDFRDLHTLIAAELGLGRFPVPKGFIFNDAHRQGRADELHAYLQGCVAASGERYEALPAADSLPPALHAFLFTPTDESAGRLLLARSLSMADASPFVTASPFLIHPSTWNHPSGNVPEHVESAVRLGSPASSGRSAGCWAVPRSQEGAWPLRA